mmetsp:Transcript_29059/g.96126  ORF Transcript_29059/g.96126 Transcript_29059/m.96126 type:complete len:225 (-) Transcript_29059:83-757(-)
MREKACLPTSGPRADLRSVSVPAMPPARFSDAPIVLGSSSVAKRTSLTSLSASMVASFWPAFQPSLSPAPLRTSARGRMRPSRQCLRTGTPAAPRSSALTASRLTTTESARITGLLGVAAAAVAAAPGASDAFAGLSFPLASSEADGSKTGSPRAGAGGKSRDARLAAGSGVATSSKGPPAGATCGAGVGAESSTWTDTTKSLTFDDDTSVRSKLGESRPMFSS